MIMYIITSAVSTIPPRKHGPRAREGPASPSATASPSRIARHPSARTLFGPDHEPGSRPAPRANVAAARARTVDREPSYVDTTLDCYDLRIGYRVAVGRCRRFGGRSRPVVPPPPRTKAPIRWSPEHPIRLPPVTRWPRSAPTGRSGTAAHELNCCLFAAVV